MQSKLDIVQLPVCLDNRRLSDEALRLTDKDWDTYDQDAGRNFSVALVSGNVAESNSPGASMRQTAALNRCPYLKQVIASFASVVGRASLVRLEPGAEIPAHYENNYHERHHVQILIPIVADANVILSSVDDNDFHMGVGGAWCFDNWRSRALANKGNSRSVHLLIHTTGTSEFWSMVAQGRRPSRDDEGWAETRAEISYQANRSPDLLCERYHQTTVVSPDEMGNMLHDFLAEIRLVRSDRPEVLAELQFEVLQFQRDWRSQWMLHRDTLEGLPNYQDLLGEFTVRCEDLLGDTLLPNNEARAADVLRRWLSCATDENSIRRQSSPERVSISRLDTSLFDAPIFIVAAPRSGSTMLFELLQENRELWTIGDESHRLFESIRQLNPATRDYESNALAANDLTDNIGQAIVGAFIKRLRDSQGRMWSEVPSKSQASSLRLLEKTPKNALRIPFLQKLFPNALFVYLHREARPNIGSIIDAWQSGNFITYSQLPDWQGPPWSLLLPKGWQKLRGRPLAEIAAWQWFATNQTIVHDLEALPDGSWHLLRYDDLLNNREATLRDLCTFADIPFGPRMQALSKGQLPHSKYTLEPPAKDKWKRHQAEIEAAIAHYPEIQRVEESIVGLIR